MRTFRVGSVVILAAAHPLIRLNLKCFFAGKCHAEYSSVFLWLLKCAKWFYLSCVIPSRQRASLTLTEFDGILVCAPVNTKEQHLSGLWWCKVTAFTHPTVGDHPDPNGQWNAPQISPFPAGLCGFLDHYLKRRQRWTAMTGRRLHSWGL